jgi:tetratricopeptide (TPR) repeat protein
MQPSITPKSTAGRYGRRAGSLLVVLAVASALGIGWVIWREPLARRLAHWTRGNASGLAEAARAYDRREWERAAELTRRLLKSNPQDPETLRIYARALARAERDATAAAIYENRLDATPLQAEDYYVLGLISARAGRLDAALHFWEQSARDGPDNPELLDNLARLLTRLQRMDEAVLAARRLSLQPSWEARGYLLLGEIRVLLEDRSGAVDALGRGLELDPRAEGALQPSLHFRKLLARSLLQLGRPAEARRALEAIAASDATGRLDREAHWLTSRAWLQEGKLPEAAAAFASSGSYRAENPLIPEPSPFVGAASCVSCHPRESRSHEKSRHARTFHHGRALLELPIPGRPLTDPDDAKVTHTFRRDKDAVEVETRAGDKIYQLVVAYAFGASDRYVTMIGRDDERSYRVLRLSSYHGKGGVAWGRTSLASPDSNPPADNFRGDTIPVRDGVVRCLYCHVTFPRDFRDPLPETGVGPEAADSGIGCERCHGPGANHVRAMSTGFKDNSIVNAGLGGTRAIVEQCADCHIVDQIADIQRAPEEPAYVRSPGFTLTFSRCFSESDGALSCLTCHDPHRDDRRPPSFYEAKCLTCHAPQAAALKPAADARAGPAPAAGKQAVACPVSPAKNCLECHMPKVPVADLHTSLTDHYIRVHDRRKPGGLP